METTDRPPVPYADPTELHKFGALAHRWWDPNGDMRLEWLAEVKRLAAEFRRAHDAFATLVDSIENKLIPALRDAGAGLHRCRP